MNPVEGKKTAGYLWSQGLSLKTVYAGVSVCLRMARLQELEGYPLNQTAV